MGRASRGKRNNRRAASAQGGIPSGLGSTLLFTDVHPQSRINARFFTRMFEMLTETTLSLEEQRRIMDQSLLLVPNKLATTWNHLRRYQRIQERLLEAARKTPLQNPQPISHAPDLYSACDDFLVQLNDGLNRLWRFPAEFVPEWPFTAMPDNTETALESISQMADARQDMLSIVEGLKLHRPWMESVRSLITRGVNPLTFRVLVADFEPGGRREAVPMWTGTVSVMAALDTYWENFYLLSERLVGASIASLRRPEVTLLYKCQPLSSDRSSWVVIKPQPRLATDPGDLGTVREALTLAQSGQPMLNAVFNGQRFRVVGNMIMPRPLEETFHEFLWGLLRTTLGEEWWKVEQARSHSEQHQIFRWFEALACWKEKQSAQQGNRIEGAWRAIPSGAVQALTVLAYDVYTLRHAGTLPPRLVARLADHAEFQGAKYEIAVAAILGRAGFTLVFQEGSGKHCEFVAEHPSGRRLGVEAKSRRRPGVLHEKGTLDELTAVRGDVQSLFDDAKQQKPDGLPFIIFIDLNAPLGSTTTVIGQPWLKDLEACLATHEATKGTRSDPFNAVVVTNFSTHYGGEAQMEAKGVALLIKSEQPADPLPEVLLGEVWTAVGRYGSPPEDLERFEEKTRDPTGQRL